MKVFASVVATLCTLQLSTAACPNSCSSHGACVAADTCQCQPGYVGTDCSLRECKYGLSWTAEMSDGDIIPAGRGLGGYHAYTECSSAGVCNRESGLCECYPGYTGSGCRRTTCPNDCSGHGRCLTLRQSNASYVAYHAAQFASQFWDANKTRACTCDPGYTGDDCSSRMCPKGDDPMTVCQNDADTFQGQTHEQVQRIYVVHKSSTSVHCRNANLTTTANGTKGRTAMAPGLRTYSYCHFGPSFVDEGKSVDGTSSSVGLATLSQSGEAVLTANAGITRDFFEYDDYHYLTVYNAKGSVGRTAKITSLAYATLTATLDANWGAKPTVWGAVTSNEGFDVSTDSNAANYGYIWSRYGGVAGQPPIVGCPVDGPFAYQDQTDGRFAGDTGVSRATGGWGCEAEPATGLSLLAPSVGGKQLGYIALTYTDMFGSKYTTRPILIDSTAASTQTEYDADPAYQFTGGTSNAPMKMMAYNGCQTDADCRGAAHDDGSTTAYASMDTGTASTVTCVDGTCSGTRLGGGHPHFEGWQEAALDASVCTASGPVDLCGSPSSPIPMDPSIAGTANSIYKLLAQDAANYPDINGLQGWFITIKYTAADTGLTAAAPAGQQGTFWIEKLDDDNTNVGATLRFVPGSGVDVSYRFESTKASKYFISPSPYNNYDSFRSGERLLFTADRIRQALQELPNFAIPSVNVTNTKRADTGEYMGNVFDVTFTDAATSGKQPLMECLYSTEYNKPGAWPKMGNTVADGIYATDTTVESCVVQDIYLGTGQYEENVECSNRGTCDTSSGACTCFDGFTGEACSEQTIFF